MSPVNVRLYFCVRNRCIERFKTEKLRKRLGEREREWVRVWDVRECVQERETDRSQNVKMCILFCTTIENHEVCEKNREEMSNCELNQFHECFGYDVDNLMRAYDEHEKHFGEISAKSCFDLEKVLNEFYPSQKMCFQ